MRLKNRRVAPIINPLTPESVLCLYQLWLALYGPGDPATARGTSRRSMLNLFRCVNSWICVTDLLWRNGNWISLSLSLPKVTFAFTMRAIFR